MTFFFQVATANLAWASVAIHQVQVSKCPQGPLHTVANAVHSNVLDLFGNKVNADIPSCNDVSAIVCSGSALLFLIEKSTVYLKGLRPGPVQSAKL